VFRTKSRGGRSLWLPLLLTDGFIPLVHMQVRDNAYMLFREQGAFIQEPVEGAPSGPPPPNHEEQEVKEKEAVVVDEIEVADITPQDLEKQSPRQGVGGGIGGEVT
jgi:hypothetical protein